MFTELLNVFSPDAHTGTKVMPQEKMSGHLQGNLPKNTERDASRDITVRMGMNKYEH